ncbi:MAG: family 20 glycosylhydrolase [Lachnospiraceae bacterium]|nr:family 20 glycosylhydrolase [Lachnospiraceae bacterium]
MLALQKILLPVPHKITDHQDLVSVCSVQYSISEAPEPEAPVYETAVRKLKDLLRLEVIDLSAKPCPVRVTFNDALKREGYVLSVGKTGIRIEAADEAGFFYAVVTLEKLVDSREDGRILLRRCRIEDAPDFPERGVFLEDRYGSEFLTPDNYRTIFDRLSELKFNSVTLGVYGCWSVQYDKKHSEYLYLPFKKHPELKTPMSIKYYSPAAKKLIIRENVLPTLFEQDFFNEVAREAKARHIKIRPLFNSFGHNTLIPREHPELSALGENGQPTGKGICTSNPKTRAFMFELYDEIIDRYLKPNGLDEFHIGFDEVRVADFCKCPLCSAGTREEVALDYAAALIGHLKSRGIRRVHLYHDTIFPYYRLPAKSSSYTLKADHTQEEIDALAKEAEAFFRKKGIWDVTVVDYWNYSNDDKMFGRKRLNTCFHSVIKPFNGYYHWIGALNTHDNVRGAAKRARELHFDGIEAYAAWEPVFDRNNAYIALSAWNTEAFFDFTGFEEAYLSTMFPSADTCEARRSLGFALRTLDELGDYGNRKEQRFNLMDYYWASYKRDSTKVYPRCYMAELRDYLFAEPDRNREYLDDFVKRAEEAEKIFASCPDPQSRVYEAAMAHFACLGSVYRGLLALWEGRLKPEEFFADGIAAIERDLALSEQVRTPATFYHYARDLSIVRQILILAKRKYERTGTVDLEGAEKRGCKTLRTLR